MIVELFSKPNCIQCSQTKKLFDKLGVDYIEYDVSKDATAFDYVSDRLGYSAVPVITVSDDEGELLDSWSGFIPEKAQLLLRG